LNGRDEHERLRRRVERQVGRIRRAERARYAWVAQTTYIGTLGLVLVLPIVVGAYLGRWLDERLAGYSVNWTISLICVGVAVGAINVFLLLRGDDGRR